MTWTITHIEIQVHDDDIEQFVAPMPDHAYALTTSPWGLHWNQVTILDPVWVSWYHLKYD